jgi:hypothetical protein
MSSPEPAKLVTLGRQPIIDYVTKDYEGFRQGMLNQIPLLLPNWTDRSESDFGVVLIELFAYVSDILSYYQDRVANEAYLSTATQRRSVTELLRLIDYQIDPGLAAQASIHFDVAADATVSGSSLPYRLKTAGVQGQPDQIFEITGDFSLKLLNNAVDLTAVSGIPAQMTAISIGHTAHSFSAGDFLYFEEQTTLNNAIKTRRSPMLTLLEVIDAGAGFDQIRWLPPLPEAFDPAKTKLKGNNAVATNGETVSDEPVFVGDGTPGQQFTLSRTPVTHLLKPTPSGRRQSIPELEILIDGVRWTLVENFLESLPSDTHYTVFVDENDYLTVTFGTGRRGSVPPAGAQVKATYRIGLGSQGNVGSDRLTVFLTSVPQVTKITNPFNATGGAERETTEEAKVSGPALVVTQDRAVTLHDYDLLAAAFPGVGKAKARVGLRGGYKVVQVFIAPENPTVVPPPPPSGELKAALKQYLESRQPVNRMAGVDVLDPIYVPIDVFVDVYLTPEASQARVSQDTFGVLRELLSFANQDFGKPIRAGELFSVLYPVEGVAYLNLKRLARSSVPAVSSASGCEFADIPIAENELACEGILKVNLFGGVR